MKCKKPFVKAGKAFGCGQCLPCRINRSRIWAHRLMLEGTQHIASSFVTLTYRDEKLPMCFGKSGEVLYPTLVSRDLQLFVKRLRSVVSPVRIRFFGSGEYGEKTWRPHYHVALFGYPGCCRGETRRSFGTGEPEWEGCCVPCTTIGQAWGLGNVVVTELNAGTAGYLAGYVVKKLTGGMDALYGDREREFVRFSNRPGIGLLAMDDVASVIMDGLHDDVDVPGVLRHNGKLLPLGRYLRRALRARVGRDEEVHCSTVAEIEEKMRPLRESAFEASEALSSVIARTFEGDRQSVENRYNIFRQRQKL